MAKNLIIVESPAKAQTIEKFLGGKYRVESSIGHIRDMPKKDMGIDLETFEPRYIIDSAKKKIVGKLKKSVASTAKIYLATDEDREGEAIAWHLQKALKLPADTPRIVFHEITKDAIGKALENPRIVNQDLVDAQQARRVIDRLVGFEISPVLWRKISGARSAGRVQSPVVRLVVEREREIKNHTPKITFKAKATFAKKSGEIFAAKLVDDFDKVAEALAFAQKLTGGKFIIQTVHTKPATHSPRPPFITSTLQQEASQKLGFSVKRTMMLAQNLYTQGRITYMRTDSLTLAESALAAAAKIINQNFGKNYHQPRRYKTKSTSAQEAHEAIRPTNFGISDLGGDSAENKLYRLIYKRTLASQMAAAQILKTTAKIGGVDERDFIAEGEVLEFPGFLKIYGDVENSDKHLPPLAEGEHLSLIDFQAREHFSAPKPRYTEASLVKTIENMGIGRPSTFASMVSTVQERGYVVKEDRGGDERRYRLITVENGEVEEKTATERVGVEKAKLFPTDVAYLLTDFLTQHFADVVSYDFTANLENDFDQIAKNTKPWKNVVRDFYAPFHRQIESANALSRTQTHQARKLGNDPESGKMVSVRLGRFGAFAQIAAAGEDEKPKFASLRPGQNLEDITLEEALELFKMPRVLGKDDDGKIVKANYGRFGPYLQYGEKYLSLKDLSPEEITLEQALALIAEKQKQDAERIIKTFADSEIQILKGRFGPYIWNGKKRGRGQKNVTVKKIFGDKNPAKLSLQECQDALAAKLKKTKTKKTPAKTKK